VSDLLRELHARIDVIRERLGMPTCPRPASTEARLDQVNVGIGDLERITDPAQRIDAGRRRLSGPVGRRVASGRYVVGTGCQLARNIRRERNASGRSRTRRK
jgi:hypothetical protein